MTVRTSADRARRQGVRVTSVVSSGVRDAPASAALLAMVWITGVVVALTSDRPRHWIDQHLSTGIVPIEHWRLWTPITSGLVTVGLVGYVVSTVAVLLVAAPIEKRIGSARFLAGAAATQVLGCVGGLVLAAIAKLLDEDWGFRLHLGVAAGPTTWIVGVLMAASASMSTLWRRRVRVGMLALLIVLALFSGHLHDVVRLASAVAGLAIGPALVGRSARGPRLAGTRREGRVLVALVVAAAAIGPMLAALSPDAVGPFAVLRDLFRDSGWTAAEVRDLCSENAAGTDCRRGLLALRLSGVGPTLASIMPSVFLLVVADGLRRGRRSAWVLAVAAQIVLVGLSVANYVIRFVASGDDSSIFYGLDSPNAYRTVVPFLTPVVVLVVLVIARRTFDVTSPPGTWRRTTARVLIVAVGAAAAYVVFGWLARGGFDRTPTFADLVADVPARLAPPVYLQWLDPAFLPNDAITTVLFEWIGVVFWIGVCVVVGRAFVAPVYGAESDAAERARELLCTGTGSALSWMTTWRGNRYWFAPDGRSFVAYRVIGGVALTTGGPVGPADRLRDNVIGFAEFAARGGWTPAFYSAPADVAAVADDLGWTSIQVAEETVLPLERLAFTGKKFQDIRTAINRAGKAGVSAEWITFGTAPLALTDQIVAISEEWVADKGMPEMGFTLGGLEEIDDPQVRILVAVDEHRTVHGVTSWMPVFADGEIVGWTLDFMRRRAEGFRPAMEFLIASAALTLQEEGARFVSLSGAPLAKVADRDADPASRPSATTLAGVLDQVLELLGRTLEPVYGFRSLLAFKAKFQPEYQPVYLSFADPAALPAIGNAVGRAYLPDVTLGESVRLVRTLLGR